MQRTDNDRERDPPFYYTSPKRRADTICYNAHAANDDHRVLQTPEDSRPRVIFFPGPLDHPLL